MIEYDVIYSATLADLVREVRERISSGWLPAGGVATMYRQYKYTERHGERVTEQETWYYQAMTRDGQALAREAWARGPLTVAPPQG